MQKAGKFRPGVAVLDRNSYPQVGGGAAHAILEEFQRIQELFSVSPQQAKAWEPILQKYTPTLIGACEKAITLSETMVKSWLVSGMFADVEHPEDKADAIVSALGSHAQTLNHGRHITIEQARNLGLKIESLEGEETNGLQDAVLSVHHCYNITFSMSGAVSIIENHLGSCYINCPLLPFPWRLVNRQPNNRIAERGGF